MSKKSKFKLFLCFYSIAITFCLIMILISYTKHNYSEIGSYICEIIILTSSFITILAVKKNRNNSSFKKFH